MGLWGGVARRGGCYSAQPTLVKNVGKSVDILNI